MFERLREHFLRYSKRLYCLKQNKRAWNCHYSSSLRDWRKINDRNEWWSFRIKNNFSSWVESFSGPTWSKCSYRGFYTLTTIKNLGETLKLCFPLLRKPSRIKTLRCIWCLQWPLKHHNTFKLFSGTISEHFSTSAQYILL